MRIHSEDQLHFLKPSLQLGLHLFTEKRYQEIVLDSLRFCQLNKGLLLYGWLMMSNHLYLLAQADKGRKLSFIIRDFKRHTARKLSNEIHKNEHSRAKWLPQIQSNTGPVSSTSKSITNKFWIAENQAIPMETNAAIDKKLNLMHHLPIYQGWVDYPEDYRLSSARNYAGKPGLLKVELV